MSVDLATVYSVHNVHEIRVGCKAQQLSDHLWQQVQWSIDNGVFTHA
jgi:hypothetical protein